MTLGSRVAVLQHGVLQQIASPQELYRHPANLFVAGFIGSPPMNLIDATAGARPGRRRSARRSCSAATAWASRRRSWRSARRWSGTSAADIVLGVRPEHLSDAALMRDADPASVIELPVRLREELGSDVQIHCGIGAVAHHAEAAAADVTSLATMIARMDPQTALAEGQNARVHVETSKAALLRPGHGRGDQRVGAEPQAALRTCQATLQRPDLQVCRHDQDYYPSEAVITYSRRPCTMGLELTVSLVSVGGSRMGADLGQRLRAVREKRGLSQADLARDLIPASELALIETGRLVPDIVLIDQLASRLGCAPEYLETGLGDEVITEQRQQLEFAEIAYANGAVQQSCDLFREVYVTAAGRIRHEAALGLARAEEDRGDLRGALEYITALLAAARDGEAARPACRSC